jgi:diguanylate cyclase (GGDEF)-like protein
MSGDVVLKGFTNCLTHAIRQQVDWVGRYGGEEFLIVLPETGLEGAMVLAERVRKVVETTSIQTSGKTIQITASFGVTGFSAADWKQAVSPESILQASDNLLYEAKDHGRNCIKGRLLFP